jgi:hypothetical protein
MEGNCLWFDQLVERRGRGLWKEVRTKSGVRGYSGHIGYHFK